MNQHQYLRVLETRVRPQMDAWQQSGVRTYMHDSAPCHKAKICTQYLSQVDIPVLPWPGNSPDLNPIETLWAIVKKRLSERDVSNRSDLIATIVQIWHRDPSIVDTCAKLIESMPRRIQAVIDAKGGHTKF